MKGFVRAAISGTHFAIRKPEAAVDDVVSRMEGGARDLELERLRTVIADNILTGEVKRKGLGGVDAARWNARSTRSARISNSTSGPMRRIFSTTAFCPRSAAG